MRSASTQGDSEDLFKNTGAWVKVIEFQRKGLSHAHYIFFLRRQSRQILNNPHNVYSLISNEIPVDGYQQLEEIILMHNVYMPFRDNNSDAVCMNRPDAPLNERRKNSGTNVNKGNSNTIIIAEDTVNVRCMLDECAGVHIELHEFNDCCVIYYWNVHQFCMNKFSDIEICETEPVFCNKTCKAVFPDITLDMIARSDKTQRDENGRRIIIRMRR